MSHYTGSVPTSARKTDWRDQAACAHPLIDPEEMFPDTNEREIAHAKAICATCPVIEACLQAALDEEGDAAACNRFGIRGGQTKGQRRRAYENRLTAAQVLKRERARTMPSTRSLQDVYAKHTAPTGDGHLLWTGPFPLVWVGSQRFTVGKLAFHAGVGRVAEGQVLRECDRDRCVAPGCLSDWVIRTAQNTDAA